MIPMSFFSATITEAGVQGLVADCFLTRLTFLKGEVNTGGLAWTEESTSTVELARTAETVLILESP